MYAKFGYKTNRQRIKFTFYIELLPHDFLSVMMAALYCTWCLKVLKIAIYLSKFNKYYYAWC
jgi:hypothetical protein